MCPTGLIAAASRCYSPLLPPPPRSSCHPRTRSIRQGKKHPRQKENRGRPPASKGDEMGWDRRSPASNGGRQRRGGLRREGAEVAVERHQGGRRAQPFGGRSGQRERPPHHIWRRGASSPEGRSGGIPAGDHTVVWGGGAGGWGHSGGPSSGVPAAARRGRDIRAQLRFLDSLAAPLPPAAPAAPVEFGVGSPLDGAYDQLVSLERRHRREPATVLGGVVGGSTAHRGDCSCFDEASEYDLNSDGPRDDAFSA